MYNIIKSLNYQVKRDNFTYYSILFGILTACLILLDDSVNVSKMTGCDSVAALGSSGICAMALGYAMMLLISRICGWDHSDKTINYEILSGHSKAEVYFARVIVSLEWGLIFSAAVIFIPIAIATIINGWGKNMPMDGAFLRLALMLLPAVRMICSFILVSFISKKFSSALVLSYLLIQGELMFAVFIPEILPKFKSTVETPVANLLSLGEMNSRLGFIDGKDIYIYDTSLETWMILGTVFVSLALGALYIYLGYIYFKKNDMQ